MSIAKPEGKGHGKVNENGYGKVNGNGYGKVNRNGCGKVNGNGYGKVNGNGYGKVNGNGYGKMRGNVCICFRLVFVSCCHYKSYEIYLFCFGFSVCRTVLCCDERYTGK